MSHLTDLVARQAQRWTAATRHPFLSGEQDDWFEGLAADRGLDLGLGRRAATRDHAALRQRLDAAPYLGWSLDPEKAGP